jgi:carboxymethylenebutenolidase
MGKRISFKRPDGQTAEGYLAPAAKAGAPGVVVIQEWWGLQDQITGICDRLAAAGYTALAPDLYKGVVVPYHDSAAAEAQMNALDFLDATEQTVRGAALFLKARNPKVGLTGFCLGGAVTVIGAARVPEIAAACGFYGLPPAGVAAPKDIKVPFEGHFCNMDDWCTPEAVAAFEQGLKAAGKTAEIFRYDASHSFMNEQRDVYDEAAAKLAWSRMLAFWEKHLGA